MTSRTLGPRGTPRLRKMRRAATGTVVAALALCVAVLATGEARGQEVAGPDGKGPRPGDLLVANIGGDVAWYDGRTGAYRGAFVVAGSGGLSAPTGVTFGPDGLTLLSEEGLEGPGNIAVVPPGAAGG